MKPWIVVSLIFLSASLYAAPVITTTSGTYSGDANDTNANTITINGSGFGTKATVKPERWATFVADKYPIAALSNNSNWDEICGLQYGNTMVWSGGGSLEAKTGWDTGCGYPTPNQTLIVRATLPTKARGQKYRVSYVRYDDYTLPTDQNLKTLRPEDTATSANWHVSHGNPGGSNDNYIDVEGGTTDWGIDPFWTYKPSTWTVEEFLIQHNSANQATDGVFTVYQAANKYTNASWSSDGSGSYNGIPNSIKVQVALAGGEATGNKMVRYDDIYVDDGADSWARVWVCDNTTLETSTKRSPVIPAEWTDGKIVGYFHQGNFKPGDTPYVIVLDKNNVASNARQITIGQTEGGSPAVIGPLRSQFQGSGIMTGSKGE